ncbi:MAG: hypothetical protein ABI777_05805 [Betaproteobacteria bacterium]
MLQDAEQSVDDNSRTQAIFVTMRKLIARRDVRMARKEAGYASRSLRSRFVSYDETFALDDTVNIPALLRRKTEQGKGDTML